MVDTNSSHYLFQKRKIYYFSRHVPNDLKDHYLSDRIVFSLKTKSESQALKASKTIAQRLEDYWMTLRLSKLEIPAQHLLKSSKASQSSAPLLSDALEAYVRLKGANKSKTFHRGAKRNIEAVIALLGNRPVDEYSTSEAGKFRDALFEKGLNTSTIKRNFSTIKAIFNLCISENGLDCTNPFAKIYMPELDDKKNRKPIPIEVIFLVKKECRMIDDDKRWLIALIADTGMRLSEAVGLHMDDILLTDSIPYIDLKPHPWRSLKTKMSRRKIPLVGSSLWAAKRIISIEKGSSYAFPSYTSSNNCNGNSASAALNKWLKPRVPDGCVVHSFRHSFRDRLRAVRCPTDMIDEIGGWVSPGVGQQYGEGYPLEAKHQMMTKMVSIRC